MRRALALAVVSVALLWTERADACAGCSNPNLPVGQSSQNALPARHWNVGLSLSGTALRVVHETACPDIGPVCIARDPGAYLHDQGIRLGEVRAQVEYGISDLVGVQLQVPFRVVDTDITYRRFDGTVFTPEEEGIHHRNETLAGLGDPWLLARFGGKWLDFNLTGRVGVALPLGRTEPDPFAAGRVGEPHQHLQFGTGTVTPVVAGDLSRALGDWSVGGYFQLQPVLVANGFGFQAGHRAGVGGFGGYAFGQVRVLATVDVVHEEAERWGGVIQQDGNLGRTDVLGGINVAFPVFDQRVTVGVRTPVFQRIVGGQVSYPAIVSVMVERSFGS